MLYPIKCGDFKWLKWGGENAQWLLRSNKTLSLQGWKMLNKMWDFKWLKEKMLSDFNAVIRPYRTEECSARFNLLLVEESSITVPNPSGPLKNLLKYIRIWFRFHQDINEINVCYSYHFIKLCAQCQLLFPVFTSHVWCKTIKKVKMTHATTLFYL